MRFVYQVLGLFTQLFYRGTADTGGQNVTLMFLLSVEEKSWRNATLTCQSEGANLLHSNTSSDVLIDFMNRNNGKRNNESIFVWLDVYFSFTPFVWIKGCYRPKNNSSQISDVAMKHTLISVDQCVDFCKEETLYVGVQNQSCYCLRDIDSYNVAEPVTCNRTCVENLKEECSMVDYISIFEIANVSVGDWYDGSTGTKECVYITKDKDKLVWRSWWCDSKHVYGYICELNSSSNSCLNNASSCTIGSLHIEVDIRMSWGDSQDNCLQRGGYLASFATSRELNASGLMEKMEPMKSYWIGLWRRRRSRRITGQSCYQRQIQVFAGKDVPDVKYCYSFKLSSNGQPQKGPSLCDEPKTYICQQKEYMSMSTNNQTGNSAGGGIMSQDRKRNNEKYPRRDTNHTMEYDDVTQRVSGDVDEDFNMSAEGTGPEIKVNSTGNEEGQFINYDLIVVVTLVVLILLTIIALVVLLVIQWRKRNRFVIRQPPDITYTYSQCKQDNVGNEAKTPPNKPIRRTLSKPLYENVIITPTETSVLPPGDKKQPNEETKETVVSDIPFIDANLSRTEKQKYDRSTSLLSDQLDVIENEIDDAECVDHHNSSNNGHKPEDQDEVKQPMLPTTTSVSQHGNNDETFDV